MTSYDELKEWAELHEASPLEWILADEDDANEEKLEEEIEEEN